MKKYLLSFIVIFGLGNISASYAVNFVNLPDPKLMTDYHSTKAENYYKPLCQKACADRGGVEIFRLREENTAMNRVGPFNYSPVCGCKE